MIGVWPIGVRPVGASGEEQANEYVGTGGAQSGGTADVVYTQVVPTQSISGSIRVQTVEQSIRVDEGSGRHWYSPWWADCATTKTIFPLYKYGQKYG